MLKRWSWGAVILMCCATGAVAQIPFTLTGVTPLGANMGGVYTSPYVATIGGQTGINVICDDYADEVQIGESWNVVATDLSTLSTSSASANQVVKWDTTDSATQQVDDYMTVAILGAELLSINSNTEEAEDLSFAIWDVFTPGASNGLADASAIAADLSTAQGLAQTYLAESSSVAGALSLDNISDVMIYTASPDSSGAVTNCSTCGTPQEFVRISMAEPPSPALLGFDLLGVAGLVFFVRRRWVGSV
jgi:hypothetical protein